MVRVGIVYEPTVYADVLARVLEQLGSIEIVKDPFAGADVVIFPLDNGGLPQMDLLPEPLPDAKLIAFSAGGGRGLVRLAGESTWEEVGLFGLGHLVLEVLSGRERPRRESITDVTSAHPQV